jgi:hypothetical protein
MELQPNSAGGVPRACGPHRGLPSAATAAGADAIVSWNFRGIVGPERIRGYNRINLRLGYGDLTILTPGEVLRDEEG